MKILKSLILPIIFFSTITAESPKALEKDTANLVLAIVYLRMLGDTIRTFEDKYSQDVYVVCEHCQQSSLSLNEFFQILFK